MLWSSPMVWSHSCNRRCELVLSHTRRSGWKQTQVMIKYLDFRVRSTWVQIHSLLDWMTFGRLFKISYSRFSPLNEMQWNLLSEVMRKIKCWICVKHLTQCLAHNKWSINDTHDDDTWEDTKMSTAIISGYRLKNDFYILL